MRSNMSEPTGGRLGALGHSNTGVWVQPLVISKAASNTGFVAL